jgi:hypothetical protein
MIFNTQKKTQAKYVIINKHPNSNLEYPVALFDTIHKYPKQIKKTGCPAVSSVADRLYYANSFLEIEIEFGLKDGEKYMNYVFDDKKHPTIQLVHDFINNYVQVTHDKNNVEYVHLQFGTPYAFVTDDKDLEVITVPPQIEYTNCFFVPGGFKPATWIRQLNSAFIIDDINKPATIKFSLDKPILNFVFNKPVDLKYSEYTDTIKNYHSVSQFIVNYRSKLKDIYTRATLFRPKKLL